MNPFRRKPAKRNREFSLLDHDEVLEVKANTDAIRAGRRWAMVRGVLVVGVCVMAALVWREFRSVILEGWMYQTPMFALRDFPVETDGVLTRQELEQTLGVRYGQNVLALDLPALRERLRMHPRIEDATVERVLPGTLRLTAQERIPLARVSVLSTTNLSVYYLIDEYGFPMPPLDSPRLAADAPAMEQGLPMIVGAGNGDFVPGRATTQSGVLAALKFLATFERSELAGFTDILSLDVSQRGVLRAVTTQGSTIILHADRFEAQLQDWHRVWLEGVRVGRTIASLDLAVSRNIPLRWQEAAAAPATPVVPEKKINRPKRTRKSHV